MIFIDSNVPMYLVGDPHENRDRAASLLREAVARRERLVTSAEAFQEILHRYWAIKETDAVGDAFAALDSVVDRIYPIDREDVGRARQVLDELPTLSARDALHVAVMRRREVPRILTFDGDFDGVPGIERLS